MILAETVTFGGSALERAAELRGDAARQSELLAAGRVLPVWRGKPLISGQDDLTGAWLTADHPALADAPEPIFLGLDAGVPCFAVDLSSWAPPEVPDETGAMFDTTEQAHPLIGDGARFGDLRMIMSRLTARQAELLATAKALLGWHATHRFCASCGAVSVPVMAGWQRDCPSCGAHHFPRTDPVVIMLITRGDRVLLGRNANWPERMFSLLAGFIEPGETLEAAVRREVWEEAHVKVGRVDYLASQPWPFPASLMFGCRGEALTDEITVDPAELETAMWMSREEVAEAIDGRSEVMRAPRKGAIAGFLLHHWVADRLD